MPCPPHLGVFPPFLSMLVCGLGWPPCQGARAPAHGSDGRKERLLAPCSGSNPSQPTHSQRTIDAVSFTLDLVGFTLIIDDIVLPNGESVMAQLGGGGPQTLYGYQLHAKGTARLGLAAGVGPDLPPAATAWLEAAGVDLCGLLLHPEACTPRAWQILEEDGRRHELWRTPFTPQLVEMLRPALPTLPPHYQRACAYHVGVDPSEPSLELLHQLRGSGGLVSAETFTAAEEPLSRQSLRDFMQPLDVFSPNQAEAASMLGLDDAAGIDPRWLTEPFLLAGAPLVLLRRGPLGVLAHCSSSGEAVEVPGYADTRVEDATGCGNAACGAFLAALQAGEGLARCAAWACAAGSVMAEHRAVPQLPPAALAGEAARRAKVLVEQAQSRRSTQ